MSTGCKPPIMPPRDTLANSRIAGKKPPLPYKQAAQRRRERQRMEKAMKPIAAIGGAMPPPRKIDVAATRTAVNTAQERAIKRAGRIIRQAQQDRKAKDAAAEKKDKAAPPPPKQETRPPSPRGYGAAGSARPTKPETRRYAALKADNS